MLNSGQLEAHIVTQYPLHMLNSGQPEAHSYTIPIAHALGKLLN